VTASASGSIQSACKGSPASMSALGAVTLAKGSGAITVTHEDAVYNCAAKVSLSAKVSGSKIVVQETITNPTQVANCVCTFDLSIVVAGLAAGTYTVEIYDADGNLVGTSPVTL
jgi:hypothetical protein